MNNIPLVFWLIPIASVVALGMAWFFFRSMMNEDEGTDRMKEIAEHVRKGAMAYLKQQYKVVTIVFVVLAIVLRSWLMCLRCRTRGCRSHSSPAVCSRVLQASSA